MPNSQGQGFIIYSQYYSYKFYRSEAFLSKVSQMFYQITYKQNVTTFRLVFYSISVVYQHKKEQKMNIFPLKSISDQCNW